ncbi:hypothetical protein L3X38_027484 [Prunus dulcis]|uniref:RNase H type-1 domain-containing protein n=1 Tax=Prunus dulcis TaxID=3755 RepID=A0AAD4Z171_PRUDU|nr:hypothetical protein L3X38_027484 [Prunus dulcis]
MPSLTSSPSLHLRWYRSQPVQTLMSGNQASRMPNTSTLPFPYRFYMSTASQQGCGAGLVLTTPDGAKVEYAFRFNFRTFNNEAEYDSLLAKLLLAKSMSTKQISIHSDSQLIVNQIKADFAVRDAFMTAYLSTTHRLLEAF